VSADRGSAVVELSFVGHCGSQAMNCKLCDRPIGKYDPAFHRLEIDEAHAADFCPDCIEKFVKWQRGIFARLFPTAAVKKRYGRS
jgi:hypothetical protein